MEKLKVQDILNLLNSNNSSSLHLGKFDEQLSYAAAKTLLRLINEKKIKYAYEKYNETTRYYDLIVAYKNASRKERRETKNFRQCYLLAMKNVERLCTLDKMNARIEILTKRLKSNLKNKFKKD